MSYLKDDNGNNSYSRLAGLLLILAYIGWGSYIVYIKNIVCDIPVTIACLIATLYGINKSISSSSILPLSIKDIYNKIIKKDEKSDALDK